MKIKVLIIILGVIFCASCEGDSKVKYIPLQEGVSVIDYDSCEYIWVKRGYRGGLTHKGNCKYCIERKNITELNKEEK